MNAAVVSAARRHQVPMAAIGGLLACAAVLASALFSPAAIRAWLAVAVFWSAVPIGAVGILALMRLVPGRWNVQLSVPLEAATLLVPLAILALLPVMVGQGGLYPWTSDPPDGFPGGYLQPWFFVVRTAAWFVWLALAAWMLVGRHGRSTLVAALGLIGYFVLGTLFSVDWLMSLDPAFHSASFGLYTLDIQMTVALLAACLAQLLARPRPLSSGILGGLVLMALLLWAYFAFIQYFVIWSADRPDGVRWYLARGTGGWQLALWAMIALHVIPACLLLSSAIRWHRGWLIVLIGLALGGKAIETSWLVLPGREAQDAWLTVLLVVAGHVGLGAMTTAGFLYALRIRIGRQVSRRRISRRRGRTQ